jgi:hypothetical protein
MADTKRWTPDEWLQGFAALSPEDQNIVRARLLQGEEKSEAGSRCDPAAMMEQMMGRMAGQGSDVTGMCKTMMEKIAEGAGPMGMCQQMMRKKEDNCCWTVLARMNRSQSGGAAKGDPMDAT